MWTKEFSADLPIFTHIYPYLPIFTHIYPYLLKKSSTENFDFCDADKIPIFWKLRNSPHLLKKFSTENLIFCAKTVCENDLISGIYGPPPVNI